MAWATGLELGRKQGSRTGGGSAEAPQRLGSGARPGSLEGRLSGTGRNHRERQERRRGEFVRFLHPDSFSGDRASIAH
jgi:hypothetical protein